MLRAINSRVKSSIRWRPLCWLALIALTITLPVAVQSPSLADSLVAPLETRFANTLIPAEDQIDGIIAISGSRGRMETAARLALLYPKAKIILSIRGEERAPQMMRALGIGPERLILDRASRNTYENAQFTSQLVLPKPGQHYILVTSASHMPRAVGAFRKAGFAVIPWPVSKTMDTSRLTLAVARHEWFGLMAYWMMGRTDELFPGAAGPVKQRL